MTGQWQQGGAVFSSPGGEKVPEREPLGCSKRTKFTIREKVQKLETRYRLHSMLVYHFVSSCRQRGIFLFKKKILFSIFLQCATCGILVPDRGSDLCHLQWKSPKRLWGDKHWQLRPSATTCGRRDLWQVSSTLICSCARPKWVINPTYLTGVWELEFALSSLLAQWVT